MTLRALHAPTRRRFALARRTDLLPLNLQPRHPAPHRRPEVHAHLILKIGSRLSPARSVPPSAEHPAKNVLEAAAKAATRLLLRTPPALKIRKIEPAKIERDLLAAMARSPAAIAAPGAPATRTPAPRRRFRSRRIDVVRIETKLIVDLPLLVVAQNIVRLGDLLELLFGFLVIRIHVRMVLPRSLAKRLANLIRCRRLLHTQRAVIVFRLCRHSLLPFCNSADLPHLKNLTEPSNREPPDKPDTRTNSAPPSPPSKSSSRTQNKAVPAADIHSESLPSAPEPSYVVYPSASSSQSADPPSPPSSTRPPPSISTAACAPLPPGPG